MELDGLVRNAGAAKIVPVDGAKKSNNEPGKDHPSGFTHVSNPNIIPMAEIRECAPASSFSQSLVIADASPKKLQEISHAFDVLDLTPTCLTSETRSLSTQKAAFVENQERESKGLAGAWLWRCACTIGRLNEPLARKRDSWETGSHN